MKKMILSAYLVFFLAAALPWLFPVRADEPPLPAETAAVFAVPTVRPLSAERTPAPTAPPSPSPSPAPAPEYSPAPDTVTVLRGGETLTMTMQDYIVGVTAGEMPASFHPEALKAQTVAARSYALYCAAMHKHGEAQVCTDPGCCQAWCSDEQLREKWGDRYEEYQAKLRAAADATEGQYLAYEGEAVFAAFHSSSAGCTEDCGAIWEPTPYLTSVSSPETAADVPGYVSTVYCAAIDFRDTVLSAYPTADFSGEESAWISAVENDAAGRVAGAVLGGVFVPGDRLRTLFSLRSTAFTLAYEEGQFVFTVTGYGHGVGMSQYGAEVMARSGESCPAILAHYYPGTELVGG